MAVLETVSLSKLTTENSFTPFSDSDLWVVDGIFTVTTNSLDVGAVTGQGATAFAANAQWGVKLINLRNTLVRPTVGAAHGTLTFFGTVVDSVGLKELLRSRLGAT